ncbi:C39 family peptidase [Sutcliffiella cohnii]|uniref:C39 family peptidase n=1 Tax=Sutcliffiella cohnii TaxID=33932 RepID=UPI002E20C5DD|nr:C39 family peptidase [Sutcliffiella cohnii]
MKKRVIVTTSVGLVFVILFMNAQKDEAMTVREYEEERLQIEKQHFGQEEIAFIRKERPDELLEKFVLREEIELKLWDKGEEVEEIQSLLNKFGYSLQEDGEFGLQMKDAVEDFQTNLSLEATGSVDYATYKKLVITEASNLADDYLVSLQDKRTMQETFIPIPTLIQTPELPNGCEITSLTTILNYYGYGVSKTVMSDNYLPKKPFTFTDGKRFGPNPHQYYVGEPRSQHGGWYSFAPPIAEAGNMYLEEQGSTMRAIDITGTSKEDIIYFINKGIPVVVWTTLDLSPPRFNYNWFLQEDGQNYDAKTNLHVVVLNGFTDDKVHVMNPLIGQVTYDAEAFFRVYEQMGQHAIIVN